MYIDANLHKMHGKIFRLIQHRDDKAGSRITPKSWYKTMLS